MSLQISIRRNTAYIKPPFELPYVVLDVELLQQIINTATNMLNSDQDYQKINEIDETDAFSEIHLIKAHIKTQSGKRESVIIVNRIGTILAPNITRNVFVDVLILSDKDIRYIRKKYPAIFNN